MRTGELCGLFLVRGVDVPGNPLFGTRCPNEPVLDIWFGLSPPTADADACHCYRGMGFLRKRRPYGCGRAHCGICHFGKWGQKARATKLREAIEFEERACG